MRPDQQSERLRLVVDPNDRREIEDNEPRLVPAGEGQGRRSPDPDEGYSDPAPRHAEARPRARALPLAVALLALTGFVGVVWYAYSWGVGELEQTELPVIRAEPGPSKLRPEDPGGLKVPHQETLVLNQVKPEPGTAQVERLLPPPETPAPPAPLVTQAAPALGIESQAAAEPPASDQPAPPSQAATEPVATTAPRPAPEAPAAPAAAEPQAAGKGAQPAEAAPAAPQAAAKKPEAAKPRQTQAATATGGFTVQLLSSKDRKRVEGEWVKLQKAFPALLGDKQLIVESADLGSRGVFYRLQAGVMPDRASAEALCAKLKAKRQACLVTKR